MARRLTNEELLRKSTITTDVLAASGKLEPKQADKFLDYVFDQTMLKQIGARQVRFRNEELILDKIAVGGRVALAAVEATDPGVRQSVSTSKVTLKPAEVIIPFETSDTFSEINLEGGSVSNHIVKMMSDQSANDIEILWLNGNTTGYAAHPADIGSGTSTTKYVRDGLLALKNGLIAQAIADGNVLDAESADISSSLFSEMINTLPVKFRKNMGNYKFLTSPWHEQTYREVRSSRIGESGERALNSLAPMQPFGVGLIAMNLWPQNPQEVEHIVLTGTATTALSYGNVSDVVVTTSTLAVSEEDAYSSSTDYILDNTTTPATIARRGGSTIGDPATVKVTYNTLGNILLTRADNIIIAIGRDVRIERDRNIYKRVDEYCITTKVDVTFEEPTAVVIATNVGNEAA